MKKSIVLSFSIFLVQIAFGQDDYAGIINLTRIAEGITLSNSANDKIIFKLKNDTVPTLTIGGKEFEFQLSRLKGASDKIAVKSNGTERPIEKLKGGYKMYDDYSYTFERCSSDLWIWCGGKKKNSVKGSHQVNRETSVIRIQIGEEVKDKEVVVFLICRLIFESRLIYNVMSKPTESERHSFWLIHLTSNM